MAWRGAPEAVLDRRDDRLVPFRALEAARHVTLQWAEQVITGVMAGLVPATHAFLATPK
jgi:hypothetical protein